MLKIGSKSPAFSLLDQNGKKVSLKDFKGQTVVIYFYPRAMTPGCNAQACGIRDFKKEFKKLKTVVLGISPDTSDKLARFTEKKELNFTLLSDLEHKIADKYHVWAPKKFMGKEFLGIIRTTFIIDKDGKLIHIMDKFKTKTHHEDVLEYLKENIK